ncbi:MAG TPA: cohesin domain-containing protein [Saprospiraceae bacterium]|nr:cohesin domain-containing protein [Saprospiraceae bacterium]
MKKVALLLSFCILMAGQVLAQVNFFCSQDTIPVNQSNYTAAVRVSDFTEIISTQFTFSWDSTVLSYTGVSDLAPFLAVIENFGEENTTGGELRFAWFNEALTGLSLTDSTQLFTVNFAVTGQAGDSTRLTFQDSPTVREVVDTSFEEINANFYNGLLYLNTVSQLREQSSELRVDRIQPNPIRQENPSIYFYIKKTDTLLVRVVRIDGQEIYRQSQTTYAGPQSIQLSRSVFDQSGMYVVILQTDQFIATQKLIVSE